MAREISGIDVCYMCGKYISWQYIPKPTPGQVNVYRISGIRADVTAIGKDEVGQIQAEIICECPSCGMKNKYLKTI